MNLITIPAIVKAIEAIDARIKRLEGIHERREAAQAEQGPAVIRRVRPPKVKENEDGETTS
jgi:hypothetical protein